MKKLALVSIILLLTASIGYAGNVDTYGIGAKATALGGAYSAYADDPYAAYYNPAGLTQIEQTVISGGVHAVKPKIEVSDFRVTHTEDPEIKGPKDFTDDSPPIIAPHLGFAMPVNEKIAVGVAAYAPWGLNIEWDENPSENPGAYNYYHSYYIREVITPTMAYKINDKLSIGLGISLGKTVAGEERKMYVSPDLGNDPVFGPMIKNSATAQATSSIAQVEAANQAAGGVVPTITTASAAYNFLSTYAPDKTVEAATFKGLADNGLETPEQIGAAQAAKYNGVAAVDHGVHVDASLEDNFNYSYNLGVMYKPYETITLGLTYRSKTNVDLSGELQKRGEKVSDLELEYDHPQQVQLGVRYKPESNQDLSFELDVVWTDWSINDTQSAKIVDGLYVEVLPGLGSSLSESTYRRDWEDTKQVRVGIEWKASDLITLRGGYFYDPSPIPDDTMDFMWPDADKKTYSFGCGFNFEKFSIDTVLQYTDIEKPRYLGGESEGFNHAYAGAAKIHKEVNTSADGYIWGAGLTFTYRF